MIDRSRNTHSLAAVARLPSTGDNVAVATQRIEQGDRIRIPGVGARHVAHTILLGHRFAARPIAAGEELLSWGLPFGRALHRIEAGEYVCNALTLRALAQRELGGAQLPERENFTEAQREFVLDPDQIRPGPQVGPVPYPQTFQGFRRPGTRGVGTRNYVVILGTSSRTASLARTLAARLRHLAAGTLDGIVAVAHTEGGDAQPPNNREEVLRALAGFFVHANVGAVLALDHGTEAVNNAALESHLRQHGRPIDDVVHAFQTCGRDPEGALRAGEELVRQWLPVVAATSRHEAPLSELKVAVQCGGSDAFSGISANPLAAQVCREIIRHGGSVNQAETDELIGAESYFLRHVKDAEIAQRFLAAQARFKERLSWHGVTAEGNPSGGNRLRGLYNIILKSLGAAVKKAPDVRLDWVIDYAEAIPGPGLTFMDSPGNDLESIGGQIASGCNLILFTTGNGSITNFPFVPTIKFTSTTARHELLTNEMDVNAGAYLDGTPMDELTSQAFDLALAVAGGRKTQGERAGHSQVSIWRNWNQNAAGAWQSVDEQSAPSGVPLRVRPPDTTLELISIQAWATPNGGYAADRVGLIMPASLCATQIARLAAERLNSIGLASRLGLSRFVALVHSEGCGFSGQRLYRQLERTYAGYAAHPCAAHTLFLEHGCEKIPNDVIRRHLAESGLPIEHLGWASVQLDGGIEKVIARIESWFATRAHEAAAPQPSHVKPEAIPIGLLTEGDIATPTALALSAFARAFVHQGGTVLMPQGDALLRHPRFCEEVFADEDVKPTVEWGQQPAEPGTHVVSTETNHWTENLAGLGACGAQVFLGVNAGLAMPGHPMLPLLQFAPVNADASPLGRGFDAALSGQPAEDAQLLASTLTQLLNGVRRPAIDSIDYADFQITRGLLGVST